jgi:serine/threonine protein kinase
VDIQAVEQEAQIWVRASGHPNVLSIIEAKVYSGRLVIVSEFGPKGSLLDWLAAHGGRAPSPLIASEMVLGILNGLDHLHSQRIIHRNLKPENILIQGETPKISDFGISRVIRSTASQTSPVGTPVFMAPEAFNGYRTVATDLWSAGVIFYNLLSGRLPFSGNNQSEVMYSITTRPHDPLPSFVPKSLQAITEKTLQKNWINRYSSAAEMRAELVKVIRLEAVCKVKWGRAAVAGCNPK